MRMILHTEGDRGVWHPFLVMSIDSVVAFFYRRMVPLEGGHGSTFCYCFDLMDMVVMGDQRVIHTSFSRFRHHQRLPCPSFSSSCSLFLFFVFFVPLPPAKLLLFFTSPSPCSPRSRLSVALTSPGANTASLLHSAPLYSTRITHPHSPLLFSFLFSLSFTPSCIQ